MFVLLFTTCAICNFVNGAKISASVRHDVWCSDLPEAKVPDPKVNGLTPPRHVHIDVAHTEIALPRQDGRRVHVALTGIDGIGADKDISSVLVNDDDKL